MKKIINNIYVWLVLVVVVMGSIVVGFASQSTYYNNNCYIDEYGVIVCVSEGIGFTTGTNYGDKDCLVDDNYLANCRYETDTQKIQKSIYFGDNGWPVTSPNCMAWMYEHGCDGNQCNFISTVSGKPVGKCEGSTDDYIEGECKSNSDCKDGEYCDVYKECVKISINNCNEMGYRYRCDSSSAYVSSCQADGSWKSIGTACYFNNGVSLCQDATKDMKFVKVFGNTIDEVCGDIDTSEPEVSCSEYQILYERNGEYYCIAAPDDKDKVVTQKVIESFDKHTTDLKEKEDDCKESGGVWTGTSCQQVTKKTSDKCVAGDKNGILCSDEKTSITYSECVDGVWEKTGEECPSLDLTVPTKMGVLPWNYVETLSDTQKWVLGILGGIAIILVGIIVYKKKSGAQAQFM